MFRMDRAKGDGPEERNSAERLLEVIADRLAAGLIVLDEQLRTVMINRSARDALARWGVEHVNGELLAPLALRRQLDQLVGDCVEGATRPMLLQSGALLLYGERLRSGVEHTLALIALWVVDVDNINPDCEWIAQVFGLTPAEHEVLTRLKNGNAPEAIASELGVYISTVRSHLQKIYAKTGAINRARLVRLANILPCRSDDHS